MKHAISLLNGEFPYSGHILLSGKEINITNRASAIENHICCVKKSDSSEFHFPNLPISKNVIMIKYRDSSYFEILKMKLCRFALK